MNLENVDNRLSIFAPKGATDHSKIIVIFHGNIIDYKQEIYFPYNRLIYYVSKNTLLIPSNLEYIPELICGGKSTLITHKIPNYETNTLFTWKQLMSVQPETDIQNGYDKIMGIYYCEYGSLPVKIYSWMDMYNLIASDLDYQNIISKISGDRYNGILLEYLLQLVVFPKLIEYNINPKLIDINVYSCRIACGGEYTGEQVSSIGMLPQYGGNNKDIVNVDEDELFKYLSTCQIQKKKVGGVVYKDKVIKNKKGGKRNNKKTKKSGSKTKKNKKVSKKNKESVKNKKVRRNKKY